MKKHVFLVFFALTFVGYSQKKSNDLKSSDMSLVEVIVAAGISSGVSTFSDDSYAGNGSYVELSSAYYFSKIGIGISLGSFSNPTESNLLDFANQAAYPIALNSEEWKTSYYGIGPNFRTTIGSLETTIFGRAGLMSIQPISLEGNFIAENADVSTTVPVYNFNTNETSSVGFYTAGVRLGYKVNPNLGLHISANYMSAFSDGIIAQDGRKQFTDIDKDGLITEIDIIRQDGEQVEFQYTEKNIKPQVFNYGFGLSYSFGKRTIKIGGAEKPYARGQSNPYFVNNEMVGEMMSANPDGSSGNGNNEGIKNVYVGKNRISVALTNPSKEEAKQKDQQVKLINVLPKNNSNYKNTNEIGSFNWKIIGSKIPKPNYIIEVTKLNNVKQPQRSYASQTSKNSIKATTLFKDDKLSDGNYSWKVTETSTGISSNPSYFTMTQCEIDFTIANEEIECLGYEQENRKFKICFDVTYASTSGDLTFVNPGTGLSVYDQTYASLSYTLVSPNPTLVTQIGATTSTVSYCFEVTVSASVTAIGFGLQGDDLDPSPITCQPGVSQLFDDLPDCICDECEEIELSFDEFNITPNLGTGNQFNFNGNINVNVPIYGIEFQVQSYTYSASPSACSDGVSSVEESGMILMPGTTINGSTSLQLTNETASGSPSSNDNATKNIKYTSNSPLTGAIPVNLTIGLPGPISGLDPSCCVMEYTVCIKVKVFYEESNCKSCVFTHCFTFNNQ
ncbi:MAG: hypothetical protein HKP59_04955 [Lutibacter sp.]|uniref:hypothetical protein n=1 Tax=Lutibacter sp. TaxID=1925666 RepID=UPI00182F53F2|nr:hypothetical protein [Lutibacter sp.]MBT8316952.1 hypothetical protein [Lutibacter sp.]NNJ57812.1 hypothetical protein [Lutibacter sp.]